MANSSCVSEYKNKIINELINNNTFLQVLNVTESEIENGLVYRRIYPYLYINNTQTVSETYICIEVNINSTSRNNVYSYPQITIDIVSHQDDMKLNLAGISATKIDYLGELIDEIFNGKSGYGIGNLELKLNKAGSLNDTYRYRELIFKSVDINDSVCD